MDISNWHFYPNTLYTSIYNMFERKCPAGDKFALIAWEMHNCAATVAISVHFSERDAILSCYFKQFVDLW